MASNPIPNSTKEKYCTVYRAVSGTPDKNIEKVIDLMGGVEKIIGSDDVVIIKPNLQWWNQGAPNLAALKITDVRDKYFAYQANPTSSGRAGPPV